jgi:hypothetical protein
MCIRDHDYLVRCRPTTSITDRLPEERHRLKALMIGSQRFGQ